MEINALRDFFIGKSDDILEYIKCMEYTSRVFMLMQSGRVILILVK